jgi:HlyD family secretion protein
MKKKIFWISGSLLVTALLVWVFLPKPVQVETAVVVKGRFDRNIEEDGKTRVRDKYLISSPLAGRVERLVLKEGDSVRRGDLLASIAPAAPSLLDARTELELRARVGATEANWRRAGVSIERAMFARDQAEVELKRSEALAQKGFVSPTQNETHKLNLKLREKELESARQEAHATSHDLEQSRAALQQTLKPAKTPKSKLWEVRSPVNGKVLKIIHQSEGLVVAGSPLLELGDPGNLEVVVDVLTADAAQMSPRMPTLMKVGDGVHEILGQLRIIEPAAFTKVSALGVEEQRVRALIDITSPLEQWGALGDAYRLNVKIRVQQVEDTVKVPVSALFPEAGSFGVYVVEAGKARHQSVDIAGRNGVEAWVKKGLEPGVRVIVYPPSTLKKDMRVIERK